MKNGLFKKPKEFDYVSVPYPQGNLGQGMTFLFNHEDGEEPFGYWLLYFIYPVNYGYIPNTLSADG